MRALTTVEPCAMFFACCLAHLYLRHHQNCHCARYARMGLRFGDYGSRSCWPSSTSPPSRLSTGILYESAPRSAAMAPRCQAEIGPGRTGDGAPLANLSP